MFALLPLFTAIAVSAGIVAVVVAAVGATLDALSLAQSLNSSLVTTDWRGFFFGAPSMTLTVSTVAIEAALPPSLSLPVSVSLSLSQIRPRFVAAVVVVDTFGAKLPAV